MSENGPKNAKPRKLLKESPRLKEIDALLCSGISITAVKVLIAEKYGERYSRQSLQTRRQKLRKLALEAKLARPDNEAATVKMIETMVYQLKIIGEEAERILDKKLDPTDPDYRQLEAFKNLVKSMLQRSAEMFEDIDFLGYLRFTINMQKLRMTKLFALELQTGLPMRDNTDNIRVMLDLLERGIQMHKEMGLKPKFGDPSINLRVNLGSGTQLSNAQMQWKSRQEEVEKALEGLTGEERDKKLRDIVFKRIGIKDSNTEGAPNVN